MAVFYCLMLLVLVACIVFSAVKLVQALREPSQTHRLY